MSSAARREAPIVLALMLVAAACGGDAGADGLSGSITVSGSSTVEPITALNAEKFHEVHTDIAFSVSGPGTGDGFQRFCAGETDISDASRPIKESEQELCAANGVAFVELKVGIDGIVVPTNPANDAVACVDLAGLYALTGPESEGFDTWAQAADLAGELGSSHPETFPDEPLVVVGPGEESGTYDTFVELVIAAFDDRIEAQGLEEATRPDYQASANDNVIVEGIQGSRSSIGWVGYAFYLENEASLKALEVDAGDGCTPPTDDTIASGDYPLSRPLFVYVNVERARQHRALRAFVDFFLSEQGRRSVSEVGYVELTDEQQAATVDAWRTAVG